MKKNLMVVGVSLTSLFIAALAIQAILGSGIGFGIQPRDLNFTLGSPPITYVITLSSYKSDCFDVTVLPHSCQIGWFEWTEKKPICVSTEFPKQILLNVTPSMEGDFEFEVRAVSRSDPGTKAQVRAYIHVVTKKPDLIITSIWPVGCEVHYELKNIGTATAPAGSETTLFCDGAFIKEDLVSSSIAPGVSVKQYFKNYDWTINCISSTDTVTVKVCADNNYFIDERDETNNCMEENWLCPPFPSRECVALLPDKSEPQIYGTFINWTACACDPEVCGCKLCYRFWLEGPGTGWEKELMQDWSTNNTWTLVTIEEDIGESNIYVDAGDCDTHTVLMSAVYKEYTIIGGNLPPICACLTPDKSEPQHYGAKIRWNASAFDPEGDSLEYRFLLRGPRTYYQWTVMQDWRVASYPDTCPSWTWTPSFDDMGSNDIRVEIRDGQCVYGPSYEYDVSATYYDYWIGPSE